MPKGDRRSNGIELTDMIYDGQWGEELRGGLGQLVDGQFGSDDIREASKNSAWVGWRNDSRPDPPVIIFEFDKVREFSAVHIFCNNKFMRDVLVRIRKHYYRNVFVENTDHPTKHALFRCSLKQLYHFRSAVVTFKTNLSTIHTFKTRSSRTLVTWALSYTIE